MTKQQKIDRAEAITTLRQWLSPGDTVYTILEHVSRSGMSRIIRVVLPSVEGDMIESVHPQSQKPSDYIKRDSIRVSFTHPNHAIATALGLPLVTGHRDGIRIGGCGMDMGFALVYELSATLFGHGYACLGKGANHRPRCPSNYHNNHRDKVNCPEHCRWVRGGLGHVGEDDTRCATCAGTGSIPSPDGPERWDLLHTDGYALRQAWL